MTYLMIYKVYFIECPVGNNGENVFFPLKYGIHFAKECFYSSASCHYIYVCNIKTDW